MLHIKLPDGYPGILGPLRAYRDTQKVLNEIGECVLAKATATLSKADRETIAAYVSYLNGCRFCSETHAAVADVHWGKPGLCHTVWKDVENALIAERLKALLRIAAKVQKDGRSVSSEDVNSAIASGATEQDIHDTVLIAAVFCMYNRYVDGLATLAPAKGDPFYQEIGRRLAKNGYMDEV